MKDMSRVIAVEGQDINQSTWAELSGKGRLKYSLTTVRKSAEGLGRKLRSPAAKSAGALAWTQGMKQFDKSLAEANEVSTEGESWGESAR